MMPKQVHYKYKKTASGLGKFRGCFFNQIKTAIENKLTPFLI